MFILCPLSSFLLFCRVFLLPHTFRVSRLRFSCGPLGFCAKFIPIVGKIQFLVVWGPRSHLLTGCGPGSSLSSQGTPTTPTPAPSRHVGEPGGESPVSKVSLA